MPCLDKGRFYQNHCPPEENRGRPLVLVSQSQNEKSLCSLFRAGPTRRPSPNYLTSFIEYRRYPDDGGKFFDRRWYTSNYIGKMYYYCTLRNYSRFALGIAGERLEQNFQVAAVQTLIAAHLYRRQHGRYPDRLDQLVPSYLDRVPLDPYDGHPLGYSPGERRVFSRAQLHFDDEDSHKWKVFLDRSK